MKRLMQRVARPHVPHKLIYGVLAGVYLGGCLGLDKAVISGAVALGYAALALCCHREDRAGK